MDIQYVIIINSISRAIFDGTALMAPFFIVVYLFRIPLGNINKPVLIQSTNTCLLLGSTLLFNKLFGWLAMFVEVDLIFKMLLPQLLWFRKLRKSVGALMVIYGSWVILYFIDMPAMIFKPVSIPFSQIGSIWVNYSLSYSLQSFLIYIVILTSLYFILNRKTLNQPLST